MRIPRLVQPTFNRNLGFSRQMEDLLQDVTGSPPETGGQVKNCVGGAPRVRRTMAVKALGLA